MSSIPQISSPTCNFLPEPTIMDSLKGKWGSHQDLQENSQYELLFPAEIKSKLRQVNVLDNKGRLYMGSYPGDKSASAARQKLSLMINNMHVSLFVNLLSESELKIFTPYNLIAQELTQKPIKFLNFPIPDMGVAIDEELLTFFKEILLKELAELPADEAVYIHCWGGHGRTGIIATILIGILYGLTPDQALEHVERVHAMRSDCFDVLNQVPYNSPQTEEQRNQARRILTQFASTGNASGLKKFTVQDGI